MSRITSKVALSLAIDSLSNSIDPMVYNVEDTATGATSSMVFTSNEVIEKLNAMLASLEKKSTGEKPMTKNQKQNEEFKLDILAFLASGKHFTATEILKGVSSFADTEMTNQRVSALLRQLKSDKQIEREVVKGKPYFYAI